MKQTEHFETTVGRRYQSRQTLPAAAAAWFAVISLGVISGCGSEPPSVALLERQTPAEFDAQLASGQVDLATPQATPPQPPSDHGDATRFASFSHRFKRPIEWDFVGFDAATGSQNSARRRRAEAVQLIQSAQQGTASTPPVEVVPTPTAQPEVKAEPIPTPQGAPERDSMRGQATANKPALIDAANELGLVGTPTGPEDYRKWPQPDVVLFITGDQHGYIEPCGCTGLDKQKGGVARRMTFMNQLRQSGWELVPIDAGNQIRRIGQQAAIKFEKSANALKQMKYQAVGLGPADMRLSATDLISVGYADTPDEAMYVAGNVVLIDPSFLPDHKVVQQGQWKIGLTSILDPKALEAPLGDEVQVNPIKEAATKTLKEMNAAGANFRVLTFFGTEADAKQLMIDVPGYDLIIVSGGYGEPTYRPQSIDGSKTQLIVTGNKGMFAGLVGLYGDEPMKYARVPLTHEFSDAPEMRQLMADYQQQLEQLGLSGLGISPIPHPSGEKFVGTATCAKCHESAFDVWESSPHAEATDHIVEPTEGRGDIPRHFDPECISCHVTGWNPQNYYPYESGYLSLEKTPHLTGSGCENCHGPGASHSAAEAENSGVSEERKKSLRLAMQLPLERAKEHCMQCHDLDNSPDFHEEGAFEDEYWPQVEH
ncbi:cytochrome C554 [Stieleria sp. TO1_6]|uniref:multiheme c-type cytochrome n=1 Tax=Stieleria tagensis TaxID=2956795 RepID=UPI00209BAAA5|nr:multiheme c-type cytochrome [Stieleria tagensis]MCO8120493.1 cytochrome C554 [Stieleria tagensis]